MDDKALLRFFAKIEERPGPMDTPCWVWTGCLSSKKYSSLKIKGRMVRAHRLSYERWVGNIPHGLVIDHLCRVTQCVNPLHLEPVTHRVNTLRGDTLPAAHIKKTHCPSGHPYSGDNLYVSPKGRECMICRRKHSREYMRRVRAA
jgi:hypothetical protein